MLIDNFSFGEKQGFDSFIHTLHERKVILCAGSGLSKQYDKSFLTWNELLHKALNQIEADLSRETKDHIIFLLDNKEYLEAAEAIRRRFTPISFINFFQETFQSPLNITGKFDTHIQLTKMPFNAVITTNYDQLLEIVYHNQKIHIPIYTQNDAPSLGTLLQPLRIDATLGTGESRPSFIFKAHGDITKPDTWVLTSDDYRKIIMRNPAYKFLMRSLLTQYSLLFVGFSVDDPDFKLLLQDVFDAYDGEIPDHFLLTRRVEANVIKQEVLYRTYRIRVIPYAEYSELPSMISEIKSKIDYFSENEKLSPDTNLDILAEFVQKNNNFEDSRSRNETLGKNLDTVLSVFNTSLMKTDCSIDDFIKLVKIERILTHHVYLFPQLEVRSKIAPAIISKAQKMLADGIINNICGDLGDFAWDLYMIGIEDIGFPLVRYPLRDIVDGRKKNNTEQKKILKPLADSVKLMGELFGLTPRVDSSGKELKAACFYYRVMGLQEINNFSNPEGYHLLEISLKLAQKANWESIESAILQDIVRPEPNPWADEERVEQLKRNYKDLANSRIRLKESIELARYKGMHRRVIGGLIGLSQLLEGDERIRHIKYASDYYLLHQVDQEPLLATCFAEETIALHNTGYLTTYEKQQRLDKLDEEQLKRHGQKVSLLLHPYYRSKLKYILEREL